MVVIKKYNKLLFQSVIKEKLYRHHYQPIIDIQQLKVIGYESLLRSKYVESPETLFHIAMDLNKLIELDVSSFSKAVTCFISQNDKGNKDYHLFVNIYPSTLTSSLFMDRLLEIINESNIAPNQIVLEVIEAEEIANYPQIKCTIKKLKMRGIKIALDDLDKGNASLKNVLELEPDFVKFDKYFAKGLSKSKQKQDILSSLLKYCVLNSIQTVLEGIENKDDLNVAKALGIHLGQGFLLGEPGQLKFQEKRKLKDK